MSRTPAAHAMTVVRGSTWEDEFTYTDEAGTPIDLTGYRARMQVRPDNERYGTTGEPLLELTTENGMLRWDTAAQGRLLVFVSPESHAVLNPGNRKKAKYAYGLELYLPNAETPPGYSVPAADYVIPLVQGSINVLWETVR